MSMNRNAHSCMVWLSTLVAVLCSCGSPEISAQTRSFKWETELCTVTGTYRGGKFTETELRNTLKLFTPGSIGMQTDLQVWKYDDIAKLDTAAYDREYERRAKELREMDIVDLPFWQKLRSDLLKEMEQVHRLTRTTAIAYTKPDVLNEYPGADACRLKYAGPLVEGGDALVRVWREVNLASQKVNSDPKRLQARFDSENASPDRLKYALVETMNFGWWNCANATIQRVDAAVDGTADREFRKLFTRVRQRCDEP